MRLTTGSLLLLIGAVTFVAAKGKAKNPFPNVGKSDGNHRHHHYSETQDAPAQKTKVNKWGACPALIDDIAGTCVEACKSDLECEGEMKCCSNGCGHSCFLPVIENNCRIACTRELDPVCGSDLETYSNPCILRYRTCNSNQKFVKELHKGPCDKTDTSEPLLIEEEGEVGPCERELRKVNGPMMMPLIGVVIPQCDIDGYYQPLQCSASIGSCWCVDREGNHLSDRPQRLTEKNELDCEEALPKLPKPMP